MSHDDFGCGDVEFERLREPLGMTACFRLVWISFLVAVLCPQKACIIHVLLQDVTVWIIIDITWLPTLVYVHD